MSVCVANEKETAFGAVERTTYDCIMKLLCCTWADGGLEGGQVDGGARDDDLGVGGESTGCVKSAYHGLDLGSGALCHRQIDG